MNKLTERLARLMSGRYGMDELYRALIFLCLAMMLAGVFVRSPIVALPMWAVLAWALYRSFSRNVAARRRENEKYLALRKPLKRALSLALRRIKGVRRYRYRSCPSCKAVIEMPNKRGMRTISCPRCRMAFQTRISF
jgi:hypothetical protein